MALKKILAILMSGAALLCFAYQLFHGEKADIPGVPGSANRNEAARTGKVDQPDGFLRFHQGIRTRDGEEGPRYQPHYKWIELDRLKNNAFARQRRSQSNGVIEWKERGPGNVPGRTRALLNVPGDATLSTWLAGAATGGIWRTQDGGATWTEVSTGFPALPVSSFGADNSASVIYAGTGEFVSSFYSAIGNGIFKSTDKGLTWTQLPATNNHPDFSIVTRLVVHPANADIVVATTVPHNITSDRTSAIMRSTDGGVTWSKVHEVTGFMEQIIATPENFDIQYASQHGVGVWKSTDGGVSWVLSNSGMNPSGRIEISTSRVNPNVLFASAEGSLSGTGSDLYYSSNQAASWSLLDVRFDDEAVDFLEGQGFYDNTILCDPFNSKRVYFGGVSLFAATVTTRSTSVSAFRLIESGTESFLWLQAFANIPHDKNRLLVGNFSDQIEVEIRFGPGESQRAHRFVVPAGATSGVSPDDYSYAGYPVVPFEVWDVVNNRQLMASFRDQNRNGKFDLLSTADEPAREYLYISDVVYDPAAPSPAMDQAGGQEWRLMYNFFPALASGATWNPAGLPASKVIIVHETIDRFNAATTIVADGRESFDLKNKSNQVNLDLGVHPDHHFMVPLITSETSKTYQILLGNDGGVFVSKSSTRPGTKDGDWSFRGSGLNTSQFYGADKMPGQERYIGGMQDNGTRFSPKDSSASAGSAYEYAIGGDGFEVIWNSRDPQKLIGSIYNGRIFRSLDEGITWNDATDGFTPGSEFGFVTRIANSKDFPDRVFTVGSRGVYVSEDFGGSWELTPINDQFVAPSGVATFLDIEVSGANANIVWAGSGMFNSGTTRSIHVSTDGGRTFAATSNYSSVPLGSITKLATHPREENTAYALFSFADAPKILRTTDLGQTWEDISGFGSGTTSTNGFPDVAVYCLYVRPDDPDILWAGTEIGIVESLDNGKTWAIVADFPKVSVWDMKGQDNEVVIATHGRGIWTAAVGADQGIAEAAGIMVSGTSPGGGLALRLNIPASFDSIQVRDGGEVLHTVVPVPTGPMDIELQNIAAGLHGLTLVSFKGDRPYQSMLHPMEHLAILPAQDSYSTYFTSLDDLAVDGLTLQNFPNLSSQHRRALMTDHPYLVNTKYQVTLRTPVVVSQTLPLLYYSDVAVIEPANDLVMVEATENGLDWQELTPAYSSADEQEWHQAFNANSIGTTVLLKKHEVDVGQNFDAGDLLLFRLRMTSGPEITAWGWALDYISIQQEPLPGYGRFEVEPLIAFPNPTRGDFTIEFNLQQASDVSLRIVDIFGREVLSDNVGFKQKGFHLQRVSMNGYAPGTYIVLLKTTNETFARKVSVTE